MVELVPAYHADLDRIAAEGMQRLGGWIPGNMLAEMGPRDAQRHVRGTMLRGVVARR